MSESVHTKEGVITQFAVKLHRRGGWLAVSHLFPLVALSDLRLLTFLTCFPTDRFRLVAITSLPAFLRLGRAFTAKTSVPFASFLLVYVPSLP